MKPRFRTFIIRIGFLFLGILLVGEALFGVPHLVLPLPVKVVLYVSIFVLSFFFILLGRDFFSLYLRRSIYALVLMYAVAYFSMLVMSHSNKSVPSTVALNAQCIEDLVKKGVPTEIVTNLKALVKREIVTKNDIFNTISQCAGPEQANKYTRVVLDLATSNTLFNMATPGTIMALFLAIVTVLGFTITITRLHESHMRISSYEVLLDRLARLLELSLNAYRAPLGWFNLAERFVRRLCGVKKDDYEGLKILCTVPTLGNISHPKLFQARVYQLWKKVAWNPKLKVEMICIALETTRVGEFLGETAHGFLLVDKEDFENQTQENTLRDLFMKTTSLGKFYKNSFGTRDYSLPAMRRGFTEAADVINAFRNAESQFNMLIEYKWESHEDSPAIHLFWTRSRALVAVALDRGIPRTSNLEEGAVTMVGFETTDTRVIEKLLEVYGEWKRLKTEKKASNSADLMSPASNTVSEVQSRS